MISILREAFQHRKVFVTGHTGFKGSWLCLWLSHLGARVTGYALEPPTNPSNFDISGVRDHLHRHCVSDICDHDSLKQEIQKADPDIVLHFAAQSVVRTGYTTPRETFETNIMGTANVLEAIRCTGRPCTALCITSDKCYENVEQVWGYRETDSLGDHDPYGASKGAAELVIRAYRDSFFPLSKLSEHGVQLLSARAGNVIGGGDWTKDALIVDVANALMNRQPICIRNPNALRPWQHVLQALSGYLLLTAKAFLSNTGEYCDAWNIGPAPGNEISVSEVVTEFIGCWDSGSWYVDARGEQPREATILRLNIDKAMWELGWRPTWNVQTAIDKTAAWYKDYLTRTDAGASCADFCFRQIEEFENDFNEQVLGKPTLNPLAAATSSTT
ncbi:MAG: CDP-glucose 4,6-dehydratase [Planctomycetota bacterium]